MIGMNVKLFHAIHGIIEFLHGDGSGNPEMTFSGLSERAAGGNENVSLIQQEAAERSIGKTGFFDAWEQIEGAARTERVIHGILSSLSAV